MSKMSKFWLIVAVSLLALGLVVFAGAMFVYDWDFTKLSTAEYVTNTYEVNGDFDKISINVDTTEIEFVLSDDDSCSIVCFETEKVKHSASVQNGTLVIGTIDTRKWYDHIGIFIGSPKMTVYLPKSEYASLVIDTDTGDIEIPNKFSFEDLKINGDTCDIVCLASTSNTIEIKVSTGSIKANNVSATKIDLTTSTGDIRLDSVKVNENIDIETDTGAVKLTEVTCTKLSSESDTGDVYLKNVVAKDSFFIETDTGDVRFENSDAAEIFVETSTGDVTGTLLSEKIFITETSTGNINVPKTTTGGKCEITTDTGNIKINIS